MKALVVTEPFAGYAKGEQITDADMIAGVLDSNPGSVVAVILADPAPAAKASPPASDSTQA